MHGLPIDSARCFCSSAAMAVRGVHDIYVLSSRYAIRKSRGGVCTVRTTVNAAVVYSAVPCAIGNKM